MFLGFHHDNAWYIYKHLSSHLFPAGKPSWIHRHNRMQPCSQTVIYKSNTSFLATISEALLLWSKLILTPVPQISTRTNKLQPSQKLSWRLFTHCFHVCLRKRLPQERSCLYLSSNAWTHCWHFSLKKFLKIFLFVPYRTECSYTKWCICSATVTNPASSLCYPNPNCMQGQGRIQATKEELGSTWRGDWEVNTI